MNLSNGRVDPALWLESPNYDARTHQAYINTLVIHAISLPPNKFGGNHVEDFFCNRLDITQDPYFNKISGLKVSTHFYIKQSGELVQFVSTHDRAWHAGESSFCALDCVNDFSIGIELEGCDELPFTEAQYLQLTTLSLCLTENYPAIARERIVGHSDISPGRKTDPGPCFDWKKYRKGLALTTA